MSAYADLADYAARLGAAVWSANAYAKAGDLTRALEVLAEADAIRLDREQAIDKMIAEYSARLANPVNQATGD